jgi:hypothetical protein
VVNYPLPVVSDNCPGYSAPVLVSGPAPGSVFPLGVTYITYEATDSEGNTGTASFKITVEDNEDPVFTCPLDISVPSDSGLCGAVVVYPYPTASDNCVGMGPVIQTAGFVSGSVFTVGTTTVTFQVTDANGNTTICQFDVTVSDTETPYIFCPPNVVVNANAGVCYASPVYLGLPLSNDNCSVSGITNNAPAQFPVGSTTVTWVINDITGNKSDCIQTVVVLDNQNPVLVGLPTNFTVVPDSTNCTPSVTWIPPTATDNCGIASLTSSHNPGDPFPEGPTVVTYTATDVWGNVTMGSFTVTVTPSPLVVNLTPSAYACGYAVTCNGASNGSVFAEISGGCLPYTTTWSTGAMFTNSISGLTAGTYTLVVTDGNGHTTVANITLTEPPVLVADLGPDQSFEFACSCADLLSSTTGGCAPYTYLWNTGSTSSTIQVCPGQTQNFSLTIIDANGCVANDAIAVVKPSLHAQLDRYVFMGLGNLSDDIGNNLVVNSGSIGHRNASGSLLMGNNNLVNDAVSGGSVQIGSNNAIGTLYRNSATLGSGNAIGSTITPIAVPLTAKVPCFPVFSGGPGINVPNNGTQTLVPGTYSLVTVGGGATLNLNPGIYQFAGLNTGNGSTIQSTAGALAAEGVFIFVNGSVATGNNNNLYCNIYSKGAILFGNQTGGLFRGSFIGAARIESGNNGQYWLDAYCPQNLPLCTSKQAGQVVESQETTLGLYPNPGDGLVMVQYTGAINGGLRLSVLDVLGRELYARDVREFMGTTEQQLDLRHLTPGMYLVQVQNGASTSTAQFVITR